MLVEVYVQSHYIDSSVVRDTYFFYRRTGGGAHHWFITAVETVERLLWKLAERAKEYPNRRRTLIKEYGEATTENSLKLLKQRTTVTSLPRNSIEFFKKLGEYIEFDWRENNDVIEIATHWPGKIIGRRGKNIKAIKKHLSRNIKVIQAYYFGVRRDYKRGQTIAVVRNTHVKNFNPRAFSPAELPVIAEIPVDKAEVLAFKVYLDKSYGYSVDSGWIAPWKI